MKKFALAAAATVSLALSACGSSDNASEKATAENVEMPAEEAMNTADATPAPVVDASGMSSDAAMPAADASASAGVEAATTQAEKKM